MVELYDICNCTIFSYSALDIIHTNIFLPFSNLRTTFMLIVIVEYIFGNPPPPPILLIMSDSHFKLEFNALHLEVSSARSA